MRQLVCTILLVITVVLWFAALSSSGESNVVWAFSVLLLGGWLIGWLWRRIRSRMMRVFKVVAIAGVMVLVVAYEPLRELLRQFVEQTLALSRERLYVWAIFFTFIYGVVCLAAPARATNSH
jgi:UDP-N-acetylmuramyl pentapeptide phosphotransferase/UDP-N-acetylglucosamine-1-phosphate transferase